jgi:Ser/Thr protein kinase RdoA (MazF antagonist)
VKIDVGPWRGLRLVERVEAGNRNEVWRGELAGEAVAVRRSARSTASLAWELDVLEMVALADVGVPEVIRTEDGRRSASGIVVQRWVVGREPATADDWRRVVDTLRQVHVVHPSQRPGAMRVDALTRASRSIDADVAALPDDVASVVLGVFASMTDAPTSLIHGDPGPSNIRLDDDHRVWLLDWDESRVDVTWHDLSGLGVQVLPDDEHRRAQLLSNAWEAANGWVVEPGYARGRYELLLRSMRPDQVS